MISFSVCGYIGGRRVSAATLLTAAQMDAFVSAKLTTGRYGVLQAEVILGRLASMLPGDEEWFATGQPLPLEDDTTRPFVHVVRVN